MNYLLYLYVQVVNRFVTTQICYGPGAKHQIYNDVSHACYSNNDPLDVTNNCTYLSVTGQIAVYSWFFIFVVFYADVCTVWWTSTRTQHRVHIVNGTLYYRKHGSFCSTHNDERHVGVERVCVYVLLLIFRITGKMCLYEEKISPANVANGTESNVEHALCSSLRFPGTNRRRE